MRYFQYDPLPNSEDHIRLLKITSFSTSTRINCSIAQSRLSSAPHYAAISYTWGELGINTQLISVNGKPFPIQKNLYDFLRVLQSVREPRALWIDAICIDQERLRERNHQVRLMSTIYTQAMEELVWLGPATEMSDTAMDLLRGLPESSEMPVKQGEIGSIPDFDDLIPSRVQNIHNTLSFSYMDGVRESYEALAGSLPRSELWSRSWSGVMELCRCEYWKRVCILQEVVLARRVTIFCGNKQVPEAAFKAAFSVEDGSYRETVNLRRVLGNAAHPDTTMNDLRYSNAADVLSLRESKERPTLSDLLFQYQHSKCHDARDHVFALLSLASDCTAESDIYADYGWTLERLFFEVMAFCRPRNTTQSAAMLQNLLNIERGRAPHDLARKVLRERDSAGSRPFRTVPVWTTYTEFLGPEKLLDHVGHSFQANIKCFECSSREQRISAFNGYDPKNPAHIRPLAWFTQSTAQSGDKIYSLAGCPLALVFRPTSTQLNYIGLAILKDYQGCNVVVKMLHELHAPEALPPVDIKETRAEDPMTSVFVDCHTLIQALILSYLPTEPRWVDRVKEI